MDPKKLETLQMMEEIVLGMDNYIICGHELTEQIVDYLDDGDVAKAYDLISRIDPRYWEGPAQQRASSSKHAAETLARIIEHFGLNLDVFKKRGIKS